MSGKRTGRGRDDFPSPRTPKCRSWATTESFASQLLWAHGMIQLLGRRKVQKFQGSAPASKSSPAAEKRDEGDMVQERGRRACQLQGFPPWLLYAESSSHLYCPLARPEMGVTPLAAATSRGVWTGSEPGGRNQPLSPPLRQQPARSIFLLRHSHPRFSAPPRSGPNGGDLGESPRRDSGEEERDRGPQASPSVAEKVVHKDGG